MLKVYPPFSKTAEPTPSKASFNWYCIKKQYGTWKNIPEEVKEWWVFSDWLLSNKAKGILKIIGRTHPPTYLPIKK